MDNQISLFPLSTLPEDLPTQLVCLRNFKLLQLIASRLQEDWLNTVVEVLHSANLQTRHRVLNRPEIFLWCEEWKRVQYENTAQQRRWISKGFTYLILWPWHKRIYISDQVTLYCPLDKDISKTLMLENQPIADKVHIHLNRDEVVILFDGKTATLSCEQMQRAFTCDVSIGKLEVLNTGRMSWLETYFSLLEPSDLDLQAQPTITGTINEQTRASVQDGLNLIECHWHEMYQEILGCIKYIAFIDPPAPPAFSDFRIHGTIIAAHKPYNKLHWAEWLVHETSHIRLNTLMCGRPHILNSNDETYPSPWRNDKRPMFGIYHGCFVTARLLYFFSQIHDTEVSHSSIESIIRDKRRELQHGLAVLYEHAKLTDDGERLVSEMTVASQKY